MSSNTTASDLREARKLTKAQREWLTRLATEGPQKRAGKGPVGYHCMKRGWTRWIVRMKDGRVMSPLDAEAAYGPAYHEQQDVWLDCITEAGRRAISTAERDAGRTGE